MRETEPGLEPGDVPPRESDAADQGGELPPSARGTLWTGWRGVAVAVLVTLFVVFAVLDIAQLFSPKQGRTTTTPIIIVAGGANNPPVGAPLRLRPTSVSLHCQSSAQVTLTNTSIQPVSWTLQTLPPLLLLDVNTPSSGTLGSGQGVVLTLRSLGRPGGDTLVISDSFGNHYSADVSVICP